MRIAVIGSGISGLVAAHRLSEDHEVTLIEADRRLGGHTHTVDVSAGGRTFAIDTGFIVYNERTYPHFTRLLGQLGVASKPTSMSFSVRSERTGVEYNGTSLRTLFAQRRNLLRPSFLRMLAEILRFNREATGVLGKPDGDTTLVDWLDGRGYSPQFIEHYLLPLGSSIWSCPPDRFRAFPMRFLVTFLANHGMLALRGRPVWRVIEGGSRSYLAPITRPFRERILLGRSVEGVRRLPDRVDVTLEGGERVSFDEVVIACHSDQALALLEDPSDTEREVLGAVAYQANEVVLHTDTGMLPRSRRAWASWNYRVPLERPDRAQVTYDMNILQGLDAPETFCVTLNRGADVDPARVIRKMTYHHPVYTREAEVARGRHAELVQVNRTSFCGAYWGFGFHEDGVVSALRVARSFERSPVP